MDHPILDAIMAVIIVTLLLIFIMAVFGTNPTGSGGHTGVIQATFRAFRAWYESSRIAM